MIPISQHQRHMATKKKKWNYEGENSSNEISVYVRYVELMKIVYSHREKMEIERTNNHLRTTCIWMGIKKCAHFLER